MTLRRTTIRALHTSVTNPKPDGRKNDWTGRKTFEPGRYIVDEVSIRKVNGGRHHYLLRSRGFTDQSAACDAIIANSTDVAPHGIHELLLTLGSEDNAKHILGVLLQNGVVTADQIEKAAITLDENDETFWDTL